MTAKVDIYTKMTCPYCAHAKALLAKKQVEFNEIKIDMNADLRAAMIERAQGAFTVPQIFIDDVHVGGCDDIYALEGQGKLNTLLNLQ